MSHYDWVFWLNLTNIALGVIVVLAMLLVAYGIVWEVVVRHKKRSGLREMNAEMQKMLHDEFAHSYQVPQLGLTMADGGEHVKTESKPPSAAKKPK